jgi:hypothetical protein
MTLLAKANDPKPPARIRDPEVRYVCITATTHGIVKALADVVGTPILDNVKTDGDYILWIEVPKGGMTGMSGETSDSLKGYGLKLRRGEFTFDYVVIENIHAPTAN